MLSRRRGGHPSVTKKGKAAATHRISPPIDRGFSALTSPVDRSRDVHSRHAMQRSTSMCCRDVMQARRRRDSIAFDQAATAMQTARRQLTCLPLLTS